MVREKRDEVSIREGESKEGKPAWNTSFGRHCRTRETKHPLVLAKFSIE